MERTMNNMNQMFAIVDIIMLAAGLYLMYAWYLLHFKNVIREGVLVQAGMAKKCKDPEGYRKYMSPRLLVFALCAVASGAIGLYSDFVKPVNSILYLGFMVVFFTVLILFVRYIKKAQDLYF